MTVEVTTLNLSNDQLALLIMEQALDNLRLAEARAHRKLNKAQDDYLEVKKELLKLAAEIEMRRAEMLKRGGV